MIFNTQSRVKLQYNYSILFLYSFFNCGLKKINKIRKISCSVSLKLKNQGNQSKARCKRTSTSSVEVCYTGPQQFLYTIQDQTTSHTRSSQSNLSSMNKIIIIQVSMNEIKIRLISIRLMCGSLIRWGSFQHARLHFA